MSKFVSALLISFALFATPALAGAGHDHSHSHGPVKSDVIAKKAKDKITALVKAKKLAVSWALLEPTTIDQKNYSKGPEWLVTFNNPKVEDIKKQTLFMFYSLDGHYIAANYSGS
ncbi:MAG: DUF6488 family protein [Bermanella sp.]